MLIRPFRSIVRLLLEYLLYLRNVDEHGMLETQYQHSLTPSEALLQEFVENFERGIFALGIKLNIIINP